MKHKIKLSQDNIKEIREMTVDDFMFCVDLMVIGMRVDDYTDEEIQEVINYMAQAKGMFNLVKS